MLCVGAAFALTWIIDTVWEQGKSVDANRNETEQIKHTTNQLEEGFKSQQEQTEQLAASVQERDKALQDLRKDLETALSAVDTMRKEINTRRLTITLASINARQFIERINELNDSLDALGKQRTQWQKDSEELLENDRGRLGSSLDFVKAFVDLKRIPLAPDDTLKAWKEDLKRLRAGLVPIQDETADEIAEVPSGLEPTIAGIEKTVRAETHRLTAIQDKLKRLTENPPATLPKDATPLQEAIIKREDELQKEFEETVEAAMREQISTEQSETKNLLRVRAAEYARRLGDKQLEYQNVTQQIKSQKLAEATDDTTRTEEQRQAIRDAAIEREALLRKFEAAKPEIDHYLIPFTTPGNRQIDGSKWVFIDKKAPLSYSGIKARGALLNNPRGYEAMYWIGSGGYNDRPSGVFHSYIGGMIGGDDVPTVRKIQSLLIEFGDLMVEKGMLSK